MALAFSVGCALVLVGMHLYKKAADESKPANGSSAPAEGLPFVPKSKSEVFLETQGGTYVNTGQGQSRN